MVTFSQARQIVATLDGPMWAENPGTFTVAEDGWEDAEGFVVERGARELLTLPDDDPRWHEVFATYGSVDMNQALVDKVTGELTHPLYPEVADRMDAMTPVSDATPLTYPHAQPRAKPTGPPCARPKR